jgi:hypothetical protein
MKEAEVASQIERENYFNLEFFGAIKNAAARPGP